MAVDIRELKHSQLEHLARHRDSLRMDPHLRWLFFELTSRCNLHCRHCGSNCSSEGKSLTIEDMETTLKSVRQEKPMICLTGGEPLLHPDFYEIAECAHSMGFSWGMTTNATLIDEETASKLRKSGMGTVSISLDGLEQAHDSLRKQKGAWRRCQCKGVAEALVYQSDTEILAVDDASDGFVDVSASSVEAEVGLKSVHALTVKLVRPAASVLRTHLDEVVGGVVALEGEGTRLGIEERPVLHEKALYGR